MKRPLFVLTAVAALIVAGSASGQGQPPPAPVAAERPTDVPPPPHHGSAKVPLAIGGSVAAGLGVLTLAAAGITWLVAASEAATLHSECPNNVCVEGTTGGNAYETARDASRAANVLAGIGTPLLATGIVMLLFSSATGPRRSVLTAHTTQSVGLGSASIKAGRSGSALTVRF